MDQLILDHLSRPDYKAVTAGTLARRLNVTKADRPQFFRTIEKLVATGHVREGKKGRLRLRSARDVLTGIIKRTSSGAGYLIPHQPLSGRTGPDGRDGGDIYVAPADMHDAHTGDEVLVRLLKRRRTGGQRCGRIEEVLVRATSTFVGTYFEDAGQGWVQIDGTAFNEPVFVGDPGAKGARPDDKVVLEMLRFPTHFREGEAVITRVLGPRGEPGVDTQMVVHEFGLPYEFPEQALEDARRQADEFDESELEGRLDLTGETIVTIDPADARDFDDAISLERTRDGHWRLGVHIADVSAFVRPGSRLDHEARLRGNSVYLPGTVIPMLPEVLSNGLASLQEGRVRFTKSVFIEYTPDGEPVDASFANSAIEVTRRFAYEQVLPILKDPERFKTRMPAKVRQLLSHMHELAMRLRRRRFEAGALELVLPEVELDFDADGRVTGAHESSHDESHQIIEEFMLAANCAVATALGDRGYAFLRRVHGEPDLRKLKALAEFAKAVGYPLKDWQSRRALQNLVDRVRGRPEEHAVNYAVLRSMRQAEYAGVDMGHYALAVEDYCHFTSPIRRYPDLAVHRLVDAVLLGAGEREASASRFTQPPMPPATADDSTQSVRGRTRGRRREDRPRSAAVLDEVELEKLGKHCSATERRAEAAERELIKIKLLTYMSDRIGEELDAVITGVERFGLFCRGVELPVEGLVHITALDADEFFAHDRASISLVGRRTGRRYRLGDRVRVVVAHVDVDRRALDFRLVTDSRPKRRPKQSRSR